MLQKFTQHINDHFSFLSGKKLLLAFSAGLDSVVMATLFYRMGYDISLAHCNFSLRGDDSDADENFARDWGQSKNVKVFVKRFDTATFSKDRKLSIQMAARELRYDWFDFLSGAEGFDFILTAHHLDDQLETFIINLSRGTGIEGLMGIKPLKDKLVRPLLCFSKKELLTYAKNENIEWREDASNKDTKYLRNQIRHEVIPALKNMQTDFLHTFQKSIFYVSGTREIAMQKINEIRTALFLKAEKGAVKVPLEKLRILTPLETYLYELFNPFGFCNVLDILRLLNAKTGKKITSKTHMLFKHHSFFYLYDQKYFEKKQRYEVHKDPSKNKHLPFQFNIEKKTTVENLTPENDGQIYVDESRLKFPLILRKPKEGDIFYPVGMKGKKKVAKFLADKKYHLLKRNRVWLLCTGDEIIWIVGERADRRFTVNKDSANVLFFNKFERD